MARPDLPDGTTWYHLHSLAAAGCERPGGACGGFDALEPALDRAAGLGCGGVLLTPIVESVSHGYDTVDPFRVDPRLGDDAAFDAFVGRARDRGLRLLLDGVFNHVSRRFERFVDVVEHRGGGPSREWFHVTPDEAEPDGFRVRCWEGHRELVTLNHDNPAVLEWAVDVTAHWLERGVDGFRLDAAYSVPDRFWSGYSERVRARFPDAWLFGEVIHGDYAGLVEQGGLDSVTQYELFKAVWSSLNDVNFFELAWALGRHVEMLDSFVPMTFVGNHDVTRLATILRDPRLAGHAIALLLTVPGWPSIYYGDEVGARGRKEDRAGGDDAIRPTFTDLPSPDDDAARPLLDAHRSLVELRRARPWLVDGRVEVEHLANESIGYVVSAREGSGRLAVTLVAAGEPVRSVRPEWVTLACGPDGDGRADVAPGSWLVQEP